MLLEMSSNRGSARLQTLKSTFKNWVTEELFDELEKEERLAEQGLRD